MKPTEEGQESKTFERFEQRQQKKGVPRARIERLEKRMARRGQRRGGR